MSRIINGRSYDWASIDISLNDLEFDFSELSYEDSLEKELTYGRGSLPRGYGVGNYSAKGKLKLPKEEMDNIIRYCKSSGKTLFEIVIDKVTISYGNESRPITTEVLPMMTFTKRSITTSQGDKEVLVELEFILGGVIKSADDYAL